MELGNYRFLDIDFSKKPVLITDYRDGDVVSRSNFVGFVMRSFALAKGDFGRERLYMEWVEANGNIDSYQKQIDSFFKAGGWNCLNDTEKERFEKLFKNVPGHYSTGVIMDFDEDPNLALRDNFSQYSAYNDPVENDDYLSSFKDIVGSRENLRGMKFSELNKKLDEIKIKK